MIAFDMASYLRGAGAEVLGPAKTLAETLVFARSASLSCAVLDVDLCDETVFPAARLLKERQVRIIFHTGCGELKSLRRDWPNAKVLIKPAPYQLLLRAVLEACRTTSKEQPGPACSNWLNIENDAT
jgi:hypothetical protein